MYYRELLSLHCCKKVSGVKIEIPSCGKCFPLRVIIQSHPDETAEKYWVKSSKSEDSELRADINSVFVTGDTSIICVNNLIHSTALT